MADGPLLLAQGVTKTFGPVAALAGVDLALWPGRVHALVGENGAGKSTLIKVLTGAYRRDAGAVLLGGRPVDFRSPREAQAHGVVAVYQEVHLLDHRTVAENLLLGREPTRWGRIDWPRLNAQAAEVLGRLGLDVAPTAVLGRLGVALRQMMAIARAVSLGARVLILDEPTSSLPAREVRVLFDVIGRLKADGVALVYVSHRFDELYAVCDDVTVLRDGRLVATRPLAGLERLDLVALMLGKRREELEHGPAGRPREAPTAGAPLLEARDVRRPPRLHGAGVEVRPGEVVGVAGLLGSGRTELARCLFGADGPAGGVVRWDGKVLTPRSPRDAVAAGMGFLPEDRRAEGIIPELSVRENLTLAALPGLSRLGVVSRARQRAVVVQFMDRLRIKAASPAQRVRELSGGNQQKVLLARWLCRHPRLLLLDEPTRGIDLGAKAEIQALVAETAAGGLAVLWISSELEELVEGCARVMVMRDGRSVAELRGDEVTEGDIMRAMAVDAGR